MRTVGEREYPLSQWMSTFVGPFVQVRSLTFRNPSSCPLLNYAMYSSLSPSLGGPPNPVAICFSMNAEVFSEWTIRFCVWLSSHGICRRCEGVECVRKRGSSQIEPVVGTRATMVVIPFSSRIWRELLPRASLRKRWSVIWVMRGRGT